ncbi:hypothetical protein VPNG_01975 [Cytospora leucostoma]|uniref:HTH APSES-type domain-containing protein n=1 Tax=Cytospora leucostoma TaxID=1230097 RepID=A0A423XIP6_9PEZI|nr:hypothetical protein VPNG_01975 [Cytospora leucostoma]
MDDEQIFRISPGHSLPDGGACAKGDLWLQNLALRSKDNCPFGDDRVNNVDNDSSAIALSSSAPTLLSQHDDSECISDSDESFAAPPQLRDPYNFHNLLHSFDAPREDTADDYGPSFCQTDGPSDTMRQLPSKGNSILRRAEVPSRADLVARRRLRRIQRDAGTLDLASLEVPLPRGIVSAFFRPNQTSCFLMRRSSDGFLSAAAMFMAAFPKATKRELAREQDYVSAIPTTRLGHRPGNFWVHPEIALDLADDYCLRPYVDALLDPAEIPALTTSFNGDSQPVAAPPRYPPTAVATQPESPVPVDHAAIQMIGDGSPIGPDGKPLTRLFDHQMSLKHRGVCGHLLIGYNHTEQLCYLQGINPNTGMLEADLGSVVVTIEGVVYEKEGGERQGAGVVFCHNKQPWSRLTYLDSTCPQTKEQALLEALSQVLTLTKLLRVAMPHMREIRIMTSSAALCHLFCLGMDQLSAKNAAAAEEWLGKTDKSFWKEVDARWQDITDGRTGRPVDVRLWYVSDDTVEEAAETAIAEMYRFGGRDWYEEHGKGRDPLKVGNLHRALGSNTNGRNRGTNRAAAAENAIRPTLDQTRFIPPESIVDQGPEAISKWEIEMKMKYKQALLYLSVAAEGIQDLDSTKRTASRTRGRTREQDPTEGHTGESAESALEHAYQIAGVYCHRFLAENPAAIQSHAAGHGQEGDAMDVDVGGEDLAQAVVEMAMMGKELDEEEAEAYMDWE